MSDNWVQSLKTRTPVDDEIQVIVLHSGFQSYATSVKIIVISVDGLLSQIAAIFMAIIGEGIYRPLASLWVWWLTSAAANFATATTAVTATAAVAASANNCRPNKSTSFALPYSAFNINLISFTVLCFLPWNFITTLSSTK